MNLIFLKNRYIVIHELDTILNHSSCVETKSIKASISILQKVDLIYIPNYSESKKLKRNLPYVLKLGCTVLSANVKKMRPTLIQQHASTSNALNTFPAKENVICFCC